MVLSIFMEISLANGKQKKTRCQPPPSDPLLSPFWTPLGCFSKYLPKAQEISRSSAPRSKNESNLDRPLCVQVSPLGARRGSRSAGSNNPQGPSSPAPKSPKSPRDLPKNLQASPKLPQVFPKRLPEASPGPPSPPSPPKESQRRPKTSQELSMGLPKQLVPPKL